VRWKGRPTDEVIAVTPIYPRWRPFVTRHPEPANPRFERPTAVVINDPVPAGFDVIGYPVPAPFVRIDPVSVLVGPPGRWHRAGHPDFAEARMRAPAAVLLKRDLSVLGDLRYRGRDGDRQKWSTEYANGQSGAGRNCQRRAAYPMDEHHVSSLVRACAAARQTSAARAFGSESVGYRLVPAPEGRQCVMVRDHSCGHRVRIPAWPPSVP